jgi:hypothetical protein
MRLEQVDKAFIHETYPDKDWTVTQIAETLEVQPHQVRGYAVYARLKRPGGRKGGELRHDWRQIWHTVKELQSSYKASEKLGIARGAVQYAMTRMRVMTPDEREAFWQKHGL